MSTQLPPENPIVHEKCDVAPDRIGFGKSLTVSDFSFVIASNIVYF